MVTCLSNDVAPLAIFKRTQMKERIFSHRLKLFLLLLGCFVAASSFANVFSDENSFYSKARSERRQRLLLNFGMKDDGGDQIAETPAPSAAPSPAPSAFPTAMPVPTPPTAPTAPTGGSQCGADVGFFGSVFLCAFVCAPLGRRCIRTSQGVCCAKRGT